MLYDILNEICEYRIKTNGITFNTASDEAENAKKLLSRLKYELINELSEQLFVNKIKVKISEGAGNFPLIWHVYLLPEKQKVSSGIYIATCFDKQGKGAVIGCAESKTNPQGLSTVTRKIKKIKFMGLDVDGIGKGTKYNNVFFNPVSFYYKENPTQEDEKKIKKSLAYFDK